MYKLLVVFILSIGGLFSGSVEAQLNCEAIFGTVQTIDIAQYKSNLSSGFQNYLGTEVGFSQVRVGYFSPSPKAQLIRAFSQLSQADASLVTKILARSNAPEVVNEGLKNGSIRSYPLSLPEIDSELNNVEYGAIQFILTDGTWVTGFVTSSDKFQIDGNDLAKAMNGILNHYQIPISKIKGIKYFHNHPEALPLSEGDDTMARSIKRNVPTVDLEISAIININGKIILFTSHY